MRVAVILEDENGIHGNVCADFGKCKYFFLIDINKENKRGIHTRIVPNTARHGVDEGAVADELLKYRITHLIAGGMGTGAQEKLGQAGVEVLGYSGKVQEALDDFMNGVLDGLDTCRRHGGERR